MPTPGERLKVTVRQLEVFDAVAMLGSLASAADHLGISQSAASTAITDLQTALGRPLFAHCSGRALQITNDGRHLKPTVRTVLSQIQDMEIAQDAPLRGKLVIGATSMIADKLLPEICGRFLRRHPDVRIKIESAPSLVLLERLSRLELESALIENSLEVEGFELTAWRSDELWLVVSPAHPLAGRENLTIRDLAGAQWCVREAQSTTASRLRRLLHERLGQLPIAIESTSNEALRQASIAGLGIACLSRTIVEQDIRVGTLIRLTVANFRFTRMLSLARPCAMWRGRVATAFDQLLLENGSDTNRLHLREQPFGFFDGGPFDLPVAPGSRHIIG